MARFLDAIDLPTTPEEAFDALEDFSGVANWDPSVIWAKRLDAGPIALGSRFEVVLGAFGARATLEYALVAAERPHRLVFRADKGPLVSIDEITFSPREGGVRVTYDAQLQLTGAARVLDPLLQALFHWSGRRSAEGLRRYFSREAEKSGQAAAATEARDSSVSARSGIRARSRAHNRNVPANLR